MKKDAGYYFMWRGWMKNRLFERDEVYDRRSAWCWLIEKAAWEDHRTAWNGKMIDIKRGQVPYSFRKMGEAWGWNLSKVQRYIDALKNDTMIDTHTDTGFCIITICNYDEYQFNPDLTDTRTDTRPDTETDTRPDTNIRNKNKSKTRKNNTPTPQGGEGELGLVLHRHDKPTKFEEFWKHYPRKEAKKQALDAYRAAIKKIPENDLIHAVKVMRSRFDNDDRDHAEKLKYTKYAQGWLNGERYLDYVNEEIEEATDKMPEGLSETQKVRWKLQQAGYE